jgi:hypothetical protein
MSRERKRKESMRAGGWECDEGEKRKKGAGHPEEGIQKIVLRVKGCV